MDINEASEADPLPKYATEVVYHTNEIFAFAVSDFNGTLQIY